ncbi:hypothetical protein [Microseira sp. BLCC-F43]|uniref:hypothetical protein n=1 Tax=Microseira sp. BLCC-F43 TaxID=3153602 RepID=UPI0035B9BAEB
MSLVISHYSLVIFDQVVTDDWGGGMSQGNLEPIGSKLRAEKKFERNCAQIVAVSN